MGNKMRLACWRGLGVVSTAAIAAVMWLLPLNIGLAYRGVLWFASALVVIGIIWLRYSSAHLKQIWKLEHEAVETEDEESRERLREEAKILRDKRDVDKMWAMVFFVGGALVIALTGLIHTLNQD